MPEPHPDPRPILVRTLDDALTAAEAAVAVGLPLAIISPPGAALTMGPGWLAAIAAIAGERVPAVPLTPILDCGEAPGAVLAAFRTGIVHVVFTGREDLAARLSAIAEAAGGFLWGRAPEALDLAGIADRVGACRAWLERAGAAPGPPATAGVRLRIATADDADLIVEMATAFYAEDGHPIDAGAEAAIRETAAGGIPALLWVIEADGATAGYMAIAFGYSLEYGGRDAFLDDIYIVPALRSRGIGRRAVVLAVPEARAHGVRALHLEVDLDNEAGRRFHAANGFRETGRRLMTRRIHD
jgi:L-amino acid N-acyltransferase YncA